SSEIGGGECSGDGEGGGQEQALAAVFARHLNAALQFQGAPCLAVFLRDVGILLSVDVITCAWSLSRCHPTFRKEREKGASRITRPNECLTARGRANR